MSPHAPDAPLTIGEMTRRTGVAASALHFYESLGLIASTRTPGNQRRCAWASRCPTCRRLSPTCP